ncbi:MAG: class I SAM-dependent methyltransferase [Hyphomicrobiales bacterium]|nr:class I SAM-dependent methyltransferase [Hyphomicrobiales bacterium]
MEQLTPIDDAISLAVRAQYEENPYPRWNSLTVAPPVHYTANIAEEIAPHEPELRAGTDEPAVLIAGCGSGQQPISTAVHLKNARVTAIDLSLAYAKRMAGELGVRNIRFAQADILKLGALEDRFDIIECGGVLHHMADPEAGLAVLLGLLKPGGFLKLGLYSETARREIVRLRETLADTPIASPEQIRALRHDLLTSEDPRDAALREFGDLYATSTVRDLLFHVQEHRFTALQIDELLKRHGLQFLGLVIRDRTVKPAFARRFPDDPDALDLGNWYLFENDHPQTFGNMYQFWCRKSG